MAVQTVPCREDMIRCHAMVIPAGGLFCLRSNNVARYSEISFEILTRPITPLTPWPRITRTLVQKWVIVIVVCPTLWLASSAS